MDCDLSLPITVDGNSLDSNSGARCPSQRELECLHGVASGNTASEIASQLGISHRTVDHHIANAMLKLGAPTRAAAVARALAQRLLVSEDFLR